MGAIGVMCLDDRRESEWLKSLRAAQREPGDWPRLVLWDFVGACALAAAAAALVLLVGG